MLLADVNPEAQSTNLVETLRTAVRVNVTAALTATILGQFKTTFSNGNLSTPTLDVRVRFKTLTSMNGKVSAGVTLLASVMVAKNAANHGFMKNTNQAGLLQAKLADAKSDQFAIRIGIKNSRDYE